MKKTMKKNHFVSFGLCLFAALFLVLSLFSCAWTHKVAKKIKPWNKTLKKRVMASPLLDQAGIGLESTHALTAKLLEYLIASDQIIVFKAPLEEDLHLDPRSLGFGIVISPKLIKRAQDLGMNALITGVVNPIEVSEKKKGIWPFKKMVKNYEISVFLNLVDTASETLLLTRVLSKDISFSIEKAKEMDKHLFKVQILEKILPGLLKNFAEETEDALANVPWMGRILSAGDLIKINAGKDVGVKPGHLFAVFASGKKVKSLDKREFPLFWQKIGEIQVVEVGEKDSLAKPVRGGPFSEGQGIEFVD